MASRTITTARYMLYPSPRNESHTMFAYEAFVPYPYALIDLPSFDLGGKSSLFAACRLADMKMGQLVTFELEQDLRRFESRFVPD